MVFSIRRFLRENFSQRRNRGCKLFAKTDRGSQSCGNGCSIQWVVQENLSKIGQFYPVGASHGFEQVFHGFNSTFTDFVFIMRLPQSFLRWYFQFEGFCGKTFRKDETGGANFSQRRIEGHKVFHDILQFKCPVKPFAKTGWVAQTCSERFSIQVFPQQNFSQISLVS